MIEHQLEHARTKETKEINKKCKCICEFCKETFPSVILLRDHIHSLHMEPFYEDTEKSNTTQITETNKKSEESIVIENNDKPKSLNENSCSKCHKTFLSISSLKIHFKTPHEGFKYKCRKCDNEFKSNWSLFNHKKIVHGLGFKCDRCQKSFKTCSDLHSHNNSIHFGVRYKCTQCNKGFVAKSSLKNHIKSLHDGIRHKCMKCNKIFVGKGELNINSQLKPVNVMVPKNSKSHFISEITSNNHENKSRQVSRSIWSSNGFTGGKN